MPRKEHHVTSKQSGGWQVKRSGASRASALFDTKREAVSYARKVSKNQGTELIVHGKDGRIQRSDSHGSDPCPPKDIH